MADLFTISLAAFSATDIGLPTSTGTIGDGITSVIKLLTQLIGLASVVVLIWGGFQYVISQGESKRTEQAKQTILYAVVGIVLCIMAFAIVSFISTNVK